MATGDTAIRAAQRATATIPILGSTDDMVGSGLVKSLARPDGNTTGTSILAAELDGKRQEILIEAVPGLRRMAAIADSNRTAALGFRYCKTGRAHATLSFQFIQIARAEEIPAAIDAAKASGAAALNVLSSPILFGSRQIIMQHVAALRLPAIYQFPDEATEGGFIGYGPRVVQMYRELMARQLVKLLRGTKPADCSRPMARWCSATISESDPLGEKP